MYVLFHGKKQNKEMQLGFFFFFLMVMFVTGLISPQVSSDPLVQPRGDTGVLPFHWWGIQAQAILS